MTPTYQLTQPSAHPVKPTLKRSEMSSLKSTAQDLNTMIENTKRYLTSPQCDFGERSRLEGFLESLQHQLDDVERQLAQAAD